MNFYCWMHVPSPLKHLKISESERLWEFLWQNDHQRDVWSLRPVAYCWQLKHVPERKLRYFGHIMRQPWDSIEGSLMTGLVEGKGRRWRPRISWIDNILMWIWLTGTDRMRPVRDRRRWAALVYSCSAKRRRQYDMTWHAYSSQTRLH